MIFRGSGWGVVTGFLCTIVAAAGVVAYSSFTRADDPYNVVGFLGLMAFGTLVGSPYGLIAGLVLGALAARCSAAIPSPTHAPSPRAPSIAAGRSRWPGC